VLAYDDLLKALQSQERAEEIMIIGGAQVYQAALPLADKMYITWVDIQAEGDTFFPPWDDNDWQIVESTSHAKTEKNPYPYTFVTYFKNR
jgi:dihydrofolate reductase